MAIKTFKYFDAGVGFKDQAADNITTNGVIYRNGAKLKAYIENAARELVTTSQSQVLTNKTIDADLNTISNIEVADFKSGVIDTDLNAVSGANDTIPSAKAVKDYVDQQILTEDAANEISYDNTTSGLAATDVQAAIDEVHVNVGTSNTNLTNHLNDTSDAHDASAISNVPSGNLIATDIQGAVNELQSDIDTRRLTLDNLVLTNVYHLETQAANDATTTGTNASLAAFTSGLIRLTNASLTSLANIPAGADGQILVVFNRTTVAFNIIDSSAAVGTAANRIFTGTGATLNMAVDSSLIFQYDSTSARWQTVGGSGGGATFSDASFIIFDQADNSKQIKFDAAGTTSTSTTVQSSQTVNRVLTLPDTTDTLTANAAAQTLTNKTVVVASNTITTAASGNLAATELNAALSELQSDIDSNREVDRFVLLDATENLNTWSTGDNATFLGGGTLAGTFVKETSTPLNGTASYKYTQAASSLDDYIASPVQTVPVRFRGQFAYLSFPFQYNGNTNDIRIVIYDATNATIISSTSDNIFGTNGSTSTVVASCIIPPNCTSVRVGFQVKVLNSGKILSFDDVSFGQSVSSFVDITTVDTQYIYAGTAIVGFGSTNTGVARFPTGLTNTASGIVQLTQSATLGDSITALKSCNLWISTSSGTGSVGSAGVFIVRNSSITTPASPVSSTILQNQYWGGSSQYYNLATSVKLAVGDTVKIVRDSTNTTAPSVVSILATADSNAIATPTQQISSDSLPFTFKATAIVDADPIGTFNTYFKSVSTQSSLNLSGTAPTQTVSDMNANGIRLYPTAFNAASTAALPSKAVVYIGKGLKNYALSVFGATGKTLPGLIDSVVQSSTVESGVANNYNPTTGLLTIEVGMNTIGTITSRRIIDTDTGALSAGYMVFNASTTPSIAALPILAPRIATLSDVKSSGVAGGGATAGTQTRTLNTLVDPTGIVTSLASNQITLSAGTYYIRASAPAGFVNSHKIRFRNITDSSTALIGSSEYVSPVNTGFFTTRSTLSGEITITSSKVFELQHYVSTTRASDGLGTISSNGESEVYSIVEIQRIK